MARVFSNSPVMISYPTPMIDLIFATGVYKASGIPAPLGVFLSISRASSGFNKTLAGTLTSFGNDTLRITSLGLLVEDTRTNLIFNSQDLTTFWTPNALASVTADQTAAPDGTVTADQITESTANDRHMIYQQPTTLANTAYTFSVYVKDKDRRYAFIDIHNTGSATIVADLQLGTITMQSGTVGASAIEALANGWYRLSLTYTSGASETSLFCDAGMADSATPTLFAGAPTYTGTSKSIYLWGGQLEQASFASSYIQTLTSASATRAADFISCLGLFNALLTSIPMSLLVDFRTEAVAPDFWRVIGNTATGHDDSSLCFIQSGTDTQAGMYSLGSAPALLATIGAGTFSGGTRLANGQDGTGRSIVVGGGTVATDNRIVTYTGGDGVSIGNDAGQTGRNMFGLVRRLAAWNSRLPDTTLQLLSL